jgi:hypothetical protein
MKFVTVIILYLISFSIASGQFEMSLTGLEPFKSGELLKYSIRYGPIHGGEAYIELKLVKHKNNPLYNAKMLAKTVGIAEKLFKVREHYESYFHPKTCMPVKSIRDVREGNYRAHDEAVFNLEDSTLYSLKSDSSIKVPPEILDMVTALYFIRSLDYQELNPGDTINLVTFFDNDIFPFPLRYRGKEVLKTKFGKIQCLRFDPVVETGRIFESEDDMIIWLSDDKNLIPVKARFDLIVGSIKCDLIEFSGLKYPLITVEE